MFEHGYEGFGIGSQADVNELNKALSAGYDETTSMTGGSALRVQSLENTLKILTFRTEHCVLWRDVNKLPAYSTVEEYSQQSSVGSMNPGFNPEGIAPEEDDSAYARKADLVKFLGTTRKVTHPMTLVRTINGDAVARENTNGILKIMRDAEFGIAWGDNSLVYTASGTTPEGLEFKGLNKIIDNSNDLDLANSNLEEGHFTEMGQTIADNYGYINKIYISNAVTKTLDKLMLPKERINLPGPEGVEVGTSVGSVKTSFGKVKIQPSLFLGMNSQGNNARNPKKVPPSASTSTKAPAAPAAVTITSITGTDGQFRNAMTFTAKVTACNRYGESGACAASGTVTIGSSDVAKHALFTVTNSASSETVIPDYFNLYVSEAGNLTGPWYYVASFPCVLKTNSDNSANTYAYDGYIMPNTTIAFAGEFDSEILCFKQLAPIMQMGLAVIEPSTRWMILLYGVLVVFNPKKLMRVINIKDY